MGPRGSGVRRNGTEGLWSETELGGGAMVSDAIEGIDCGVRRNGRVISSVRRNGWDDVCCEAE
jgi:hypothetical protein